MENLKYMTEKTLKRLQSEELKILKEVDRICKKSGIKYFLTGGTLLGAVRHKGFIPWDDDLDIAMMRQEYDRFSCIAETELGDQYVWQTMENDSEYPGPYGKVRIKGTVCLESSAKKIKNNGIYMDVFAVDDGYDSEIKHTILKHRLTHLGRMLFVKSGFKLWIKDGKYNIVKKLAFTPYILAANFMSHETIVRKYNYLRKKAKAGDWVYEQEGNNAAHRYKKAWIEPLKQMKFEDGVFPVPNCIHRYLKTAYGDYMVLPPENKRYNRHGFSYLDFGDGINRA